jgi:hypothetical protein
MRIPSSLGRSFQRNLDHDRHAAALCRSYLVNSRQATDCFCSRYNPLSCAPIQKFPCLLLEMPRHDRHDPNGADELKGPDEPRTNLHCPGIFLGISDGHIWDSIGLNHVAHIVRWGTGLLRDSHFHPEGLSLIERCFPDGIL